MGLSTVVESRVDILESFFFDFSTVRQGETSSPRQLGSAMIRRRSLEELAEVGVDGRGETEVGDEMEHPLAGARERRERGVSE